MCFLLFTVAAIGIAVYFTFGLVFRGLFMIDYGYYYLLISLLLPFVFLRLPARSGQVKIPWYDFMAALAAFGIAFYFFLHAQQTIDEGWPRGASLPNTLLALILCLLVLESARRTGGPIFAAVALFFFLVPLFAHVLPSYLKGISFSFTKAIGYQAFGSEGLLGIPMRVTGSILIGFLVFAGMLTGTGAGDFFVKLALSVAGRFRGGPAKVAVIGSALFGTMSGSAISNVVAIGAITIPTMKRIGYPAEYAGAIEACASTGGILMPPVMGAVAFIMASFLSVPYASIVVAAFIPAILYYLGLLLQVDAYAARVGLKGLKKEETPSLWQTLKDGWHFLFVVVFLMWGLLYMRWEAMSPWYASGVLVVLSMMRKKSRLDARKFVAMLAGIGGVLVDTLGVILPIGLIIAGLTITGIAPALSIGVVALSHGIPLLALLAGALVTIIMGMAGLVTPAYIFLALTLAPGLVKVGFDVFSVHLFLIYYSMLGCITPPVAVAAFVGAAIAGADPMKTAIQATRLGIVLFFIPFFFVFEPALVLHAPVTQILWAISTCVVGIVLLAAGLEGYLLGVGRVGIVARPILAIAGILVATPDWRAKLIGAVLAVVLGAYLLIRRRVPTPGTIRTPG